MYEKYEQILKPDEIVLVQDGPLNEELYKSIYEWKNKLGDTLKILPLEKNVGLGEALNAGIKHCSYELIARIQMIYVCQIGLRNRLDFLKIMMLI